MRRRQPANWRELLLTALGAFCRGDCTAALDLQPWAQDHQLRAAVGAGTTPGGIGSDGLPERARLRSGRSWNVAVRKGAAVSPEVTP